MIAGRAVLIALVAGLTLGAAPQRDGKADVFASFWAARDPNAAARTTDAIETSGETFAEVLQSLKRGRPYAQAVETGIIQQSRKDFRYTIEIPRDYDTSRRYPVRIHLHGGVMRDPSAVRTPAGIGSLAGTTDQIYILPVGSSAAPWWGRAQVENLRAILDGVKRTYNVDENRVTLSGVSDGGTGAFYVAMADTTPYGAFVSLNGFVIVLRGERLVEGDLFPNNLRAKPWYVVNGGRDRLYPTTMVEPFLSHLYRGGVSIEYRPQPEAGHETSWWPNVKGEVDAFLRDHRRAALPDRLSWEASDVEAAGRAHWLVIDELGATRTDALLSDVNELEAAPNRRLMFEHQHRPGRVDLLRTGNLVQATTSGVRRFTLLLSPDQFDFSQPVRVTVNGRTAFEGRVEASTKTLLKWAARDNDRTMLFGGEISIRP
jgi:hypothetical protein